MENSSLLFSLLNRGVVVITTRQLHSTELQFKSCPDLNHFNFPLVVASSKNVILCARLIKQRRCRTAPLCIPFFEIHYF